MKILRKLLIIFIILFLLYILLKKKKRKLNIKKQIKLQNIPQIKDKLDIKQDVNKITPTYKNDNIERVGYYHNRSLGNVNSNGIKSIFHSK
jgi:hypothetical protein